MVNQDILEGLKNALAKGHSLEHAMTSFHNAGYSNQEIEEAARQLHKPTHEVQKQPVPKEKPKQVAKPVETKPTEVKEEQPEEKKLTKQEVSKYEEKTNHGFGFDCPYVLLAFAWDRIRPGRIGNKCKRTRVYKKQRL